MRPLTDLTGMKFNQLTVVRLHHKDERFRCYWECICDCDNIVVVRSDCFKTKNTQSCGCLNKKLSSKRLREAITKHGFHNERLHSIWCHMKDRCSESARGSERGKNYVDLGVCVCSEWRDYMVFREWSLNNGYCDELTLDRKNPFGNYEPNNCRWVTMKVQGRNKRDSIFIEYNGEKRHLKEWAEILGIKYHTLFQRYEINQDPKYILRPINGGKRV